jgi:hypothetical protein
VNLKDDEEVSSLEEVEDESNWPGGSKAEEKAVNKHL